MPQRRNYAKDVQETTPEDAPGARATSDSTQIREQSAAEGMRQHQPDYNVAVDYRTSCAVPTVLP